MPVVVPEAPADEHGPHEDHSDAGLTDQRAARADEVSLRVEQSQQQHHAWPKQRYAANERGCPEQQGGRNKPTQVIAAKRPHPTEQACQLQREEQSLRQQHATEGNRRQR